MKKVTLVALAFPRRDLSPALVSLAEFARQDPGLRTGFEFSLRQFLYRDNMESVSAELLSEPGDVYGFSCYVWNVQECLQVAKLIKENNPRAVVLFGGPEASGLAELLLQKYHFVDYVIKGEGEEPLQKFLLHLSGNLNIDKVPALVYRNNNGEVLQNPRNKLLDFASLPSHYTNNEYLNYLNKVKEPVTVSFETARGCPFSCRYCAWGSRQVRFRPVPQVLSDLGKMLKHPSVARIYITDSDIFMNKQRGKTILNFLLENNHRKLPVIFEVYPELLDEETTKLVARFDEDEFAFGLQSSAPEVLESINRRFNPERYKRNILKLKSANPDLRMWFSLIIGLPGDCLNTFKESLAFAVSMAPYSLYVHEFLCLPGSEFFNTQEQYGFLCQTEAPHKLVYH
ncbi:MAG: radical SAM protein, partial [Planctomycetota bacterium]